jgi:hypothetical protein
MIKINPSNKGTFSFEGKTKKLVAAKYKQTANSFSTSQVIISYFFFFTFSL